MLQTLNELDTNLFLWLNGRYTPWLDPIMIGITERNTWIPFYALLVVWLIYTYRRQAAGLILTIIAAVAVGDQLSSSVFKPLTHRLRPCHTAAIQKVMHPVMECGGQYGFVSSHAATTFALATTLWLLLGKRHPWLKWGFLWAAVVSYSRIYVAAHYPLDVLAGTGVGVISSILCVAVYQKIRLRSSVSSEH
ncbi:phosphatase PAP2 family protein [Spirosoma endophyticum]|uniref:Undecaprenyl-diphosphatase n=1 Tax=Spirosoma endophyticum TaxID=662367 RepID=A0A1I2F4W3_9BACT|nr:phosphatase PAP2 family protein [Spirosoma endophyticum]SFE99591.1 undecaprenyl-diphosphatase [Spirosoma endophyticum]